MFSFKLCLGYIRVFYSVPGCIPWACIRLWPSSARENADKNRRGPESAVTALNQQKVASPAHGIALEVWISRQRDAGDVMVEAEVDELGTMLAPKLLPA
jgi:hypothetical protein